MSGRMDALKTSGRATVGAESVAMSPSSDWTETRGRAAAIGEG